MGCCASFWSSKKNLRDREDIEANQSNKKQNKLFRKIQQSRSNSKPKVRESTTIEICQDQDISNQEMAPSSFAVPFSTEKQIVTNAPSSLQNTNVVKDSVIHQKTHIQPNSIFPLRSNYNFNQGRFKSQQPQTNIGNDLIPELQKRSLYQNVHHHELKSIKSRDQVSSGSEYAKPHKFNMNEKDANISISNLIYPYTKYAKNNTASLKTDIPQMTHIGRTAYNVSIPTSNTVSTPSQNPSTKTKENNYTLPKPTHVNVRFTNYNVTQSNSMIKNNLDLKLQDNSAQNKLKHQNAITKIAGTYSFETSFGPDINTKIHEGKPRKDNNPLYPAIKTISNDKQNSSRNYCQKTMEGSHEYSGTNQPVTMDHKESDLAHRKKSIPARAFLEVEGADAKLATRRNMPSAADPKMVKSPNMEYCQPIENIKAENKSSKSVEQEYFKKTTGDTVNNIESFQEPMEFKREQVISNKDTAYSTSYNNPIITGHCKPLEHAEADNPEFRESKKVQYTDIRVLKENINFEKKPGHTDIEDYSVGTKLTKLDGSKVEMIATLSALNSFKLESGFIETSTSDVSGHEGHNGSSNGTNFKNLSTDLIKPVQKANKDIQNKSLDEDDKTITENFGVYDNQDQISRPFLSDDISHNNPFKQLRSHFGEEQNISPHNYFEIDQKSKTESIFANKTDNIIDLLDTNKSNKENDTSPDALIQKSSTKYNFNDQHADLHIEVHSKGFQISKEKTSTNLSRIQTSNSSQFKQITEQDPNNSFQTFNSHLSYNVLTPPNTNAANTSDNFKTEPVVAGTNDFYLLYDDQMDLLKTPPLKEEYNTEKIADEKSDVTEVKQIFAATNDSNTSESITNKNELELKSVMAELKYKSLYTKEHNLENQSLEKLETPTLSVDEESNAINKEITERDPDNTPLSIETHSSDITLSPQKINVQKFSQNIDSSQEDATMKSGLTTLNDSFQFNPNKKFDSLEIPLPGQKRNIETTDDQKSDIPGIKEECTTSNQKSSEVIRNKNELELNSDKYNIMEDISMKTNDIDLINFSGSFIINTDIAYHDQETDCENQNLNILSSTLGQDYYAAVQSNENDSKSENEGISKNITSKKNMEPLPDKRTEKPLALNSSQILSDIKEICTTNEQTSSEVITNKNEPELINKSVINTLNSGKDNPMEDITVKLNDIELIYNLDPSITEADIAYHHQKTNCENKNFDIWSSTSGQYNYAAVQNNLIYETEEIPKNITNNKNIELTVDRFMSLPDTSKEIPQTLNSNQIFTVRKESETSITNNVTFEFETRGRTDSQIQDNKDLLSEQQSHVKAKLNLEPIRSRSRSNSAKDREENILIDDISSLPYKENNLLKSQGGGHNIINSDSKDNDRDSSLSTETIQNLDKGMNKIWILENNLEQQVPATHICQPNTLNIQSVCDPNTSLMTPQHNTNEIHPLLVSDSGNSSRTHLGNNKFDNLDSQRVENNNLGNIEIAQTTTETQDKITYFLQTNLHEISHLSKENYAWSDSSLYTKNQQEDNPFNTEENKTKSEIDLIDDKKISSDAAVRQLSIRKDVQSVITKRTGVTVYNQVGTYFIQKSQPTNISKNDIDPKNGVEYVQSKDKKFKSNINSSAEPAHERSRETDASLAEGYGEENLNTRSSTHGTKKYVIIPTKLLKLDDLGTTQLDKIAPITSLAVPNFKNTELRLNKGDTVQLKETDIEHKTFPNEDRLFESIGKEDTFSLGKKQTDEDDQISYKTPKDTIIEENNESLATIHNPPKTVHEQINSCCPESEPEKVDNDEIDPKLYEAVTKSLEEVRIKALPFEKEIDKFAELEDSNKYYYIEESLRRLIDKLDDMFDNIGDHKVLREKRKKVYKYIFPLFDRLDEKVAENRQRIQNNISGHR